MRWVLGKVDSLIGTIIAAISGLMTWQLLAFIAAYQQRLGGHHDEARHAYSELLAGRTGAAITDPVLRDKFLALARERVDALHGAYQAIDHAGVFVKPIVFFVNVDPDIALATLRDFQPALPLDVPSLVFGAAGMVIGWLAWELIKAPVALLAGRRRAAP